MSDSADLIVFDAETIIDRATFDDPDQYPAGIPYVLVNGVFAVDERGPAGRGCRSPGGPSPTTRPFMLTRIAQSSRRISNLFARSTIPGPRERYPLHFLVRLAQDKLALFAEMATYGDVTRIRIGPQDVVLLMHPDDIRRVLVTEQRNFCKGLGLNRAELLLGEGLLTSNGETHLRQRRLMQPAFHRERIIHYGNVMADYTSRMSETWQPGQQLDVHDEMMRLTLAIAGRTLFDADVEGDAKDIEAALGLSLRLFNYSVVLGDLLERAPLPFVRKVHRAIHRMDEIIQRIIDERRAQPGVDRGDLLSMLLAAQDVDNGGTGMSDKQLRDEVVTLLMAGHETTANWMSWTLYLLSQHRSEEARLHEELERVLGGRAPSVNDLPRLEYTRRVLAESMRLYPPAWTLERRALADFEVQGHRIRAGALLLLPQFLVHRDERWWPEPTCFSPERWTAESEAARRRFTYFPFGAGTRVCIGENFAWQEAMIVLAAIAQSWTMEYAGSEPPVLDAQVTLRPKDGLPMRLRRRESPRTT